MSQTSPPKARSASIVSSVEPSCETQTRMSARGGRRTASSAWIARPPVWAAWNDVPHPVKTTSAPCGSRFSVGPPAQLLGLRDHRATRLPSHTRLYPIAAVPVRAFLFDFDGLL